MVNDLTVRDYEIKARAIININTNEIVSFEFKVDEGERVVLTPDTERWGYFRVSENGVVTIALAKGVVEQNADEHNEI